MKIDLKKLIQKILDHRRGPKIFVAVFTILLSCISFSSASSFQQSNYYTVNSPSYYQFSPFNDLGLTSDGFICFQIGGGKLNSFNITDSNWTSIAYFDGQDIGNFANSICFYLSDFSQNYNLMINSNYQLSVQYYYMYVVQTPPNCSSCESELSVCQNNFNQCKTQAYNYYQDLNTCSSNFQSCQGYLNTCQTDYSSCSSSLSSCQSDLSTLSGYVSSLEGELNQCTNDLINCSSSSNSGSCESGSNWSALYINDIQHLGKPNIFITIPEEINWTYTSEGDDFDLNVSGYNVDTEYIENVIDIQNTKPSQDDFNKIISEVIPLFIPGLFIVLFIYFVFRFVKKVF